MTCLRAVNVTQAAQHEALFVKRSYKTRFVPLCSEHRQALQEQLLRCYLIALIARHEPQGSERPGQTPVVADLAPERQALLVHCACRSVIILKIRDLCRVDECQG